MSDSIIITALICATVLCVFHMSLSSQDGGDENDG